MSALAKHMLCQGERDILNCPADGGRANNGILLLARHMVKFRGSKSECMKGNRIATAYRIEQNCRGVIHISVELGMIPGQRASRYSDNETDKSRSGLIVKDETCIDEFCPPERFEVLCSLIA